MNNWKTLINWKKKKKNGKKKNWKCLKIFRATSQEAIKKVVNQDYSRGKEKSVKIIIIMKIYS